VTSRFLPSGSFRNLRVGQFHIAQERKTSPMPDPIFAETSKICIPGRTLSIFRRTAAASNSAASAISILVMIATSELLKIV
jgi:hypothetical protein